MASEWALSADDIVWRRSKLGLRLSASEIAAIDDWIGTRAGRRQGRHRARRAPAFGGDGLSAVHQLSFADGLRKHCLPAAGAGQAARGNRKPGAGGREAPETGAVSEPHAAAIVRRPAA